MKIQKEYLFVIISGMLSGVIVFSAKIFQNFGLSLYETATLPYLITFAVLLPVIFFNKENRPKVQLIPLLVLYGFTTAIINFSQFAGVFLGVPIAIVVLLLYTQPLWTTLISKFILKEKLYLENIIACILVLLGVVVLVDPLHLPSASAPGIIVSLIGGLGLSGWIVIGSLLSKKGNDPIGTLFSGMMIMLLFAFALMPFVRGMVTDPSLTHWSLSWPVKIWAFIIGFSVLMQVTNHLFYLNGVKKVRTVDAGIIMLLEPVVGAILAAIFFHQPITLGIIVGGVLIIIANYLVLKTTNKGAL